jgi:glucokinase
MSEYLLGIDWGGTRIKLGAVSAEGKILCQEIMNTPNTAGAQEVYDMLAGRLRTIIERIGTPLGIGLGLTGPTDPDTGVVLLPGKISGLEGFPIVQRMRADFGVPVWAENDGKVALYAEKHIGKARGRSWVVLLTIGTGIGSGVMLDGKILKDPRFMFGIQAGHLVIDQSCDQLCLTGARGTGEMLCSATALVLGVRSGLQRGIPSRLAQQYWTDPHSVDFKTIVEEGIAHSDALCIDELKRWTRRLGWLLVNTVHAYSPEIIILAGGAMAASRFFLEEVQAHVAKHIFRFPPHEALPIVVSEIGDPIGVIGAAMMVKERLHAQSS